MCSKVSEYVSFYYTGPCTLCSVKAWTIESTLATALLLTFMVLSILAVLGNRPDLKIASLAIVGPGVLLLAASIVTLVCVMNKGQKKIELGHS